MTTGRTTEEAFMSIGELVRFRAYRKRWMKGIITAIDGKSVTVLSNGKKYHVDPAQLRGMQ